MNILYQEQTNVKNRQDLSTSFSVEVRAWEDKDDEYGRRDVVMSACAWRDEDMLFLERVLCPRDRTDAAYIRAGIDRFDKLARKYGGRMQAADTVTLFDSEPAAPTFHIRREELVVLVEHLQLALQADRAQLDDFTIPTLDEMANTASELFDWLTGGE